MWSESYSAMASRMSRRAILMAAISLPLIGVGCESHHHHRDEVVVRERVYTDVAPPQDRVEVITVRPSPDHIWVKGHYIWRGGRHDWVSGSWVLAPRHDAVYEPGHWDRDHGRYFWIEGHWR